MKIERYLKKHPDLPEPVREVLREAVAFVESGGDDPVSLALAVADMLAGKKKKSTTPVASAATLTTFAAVVPLPPPTKWTYS